MPTGTPLEPTPQGVFVTSATIYDTLLDLKMEVQTLKSDIANSAADSGRVRQLTSAVAGLAVTQTITIAYIINRALSTLS